MVFLPVIAALIVFLLPSGRPTAVSADAGQPAEPDLQAIGMTEDETAMQPVPTQSRTADAAESGPEDPSESFRFSRLLRPSSPSEKALSEMTLREKVFQLFIVFPDQITGGKAVTEAGDAVREGLQDSPTGGLILDRSNMESAEQLRALVEDTQSFSRIPLLITCDEEGGRVNRLMGAIGTTYVGPMLSYRAQGVETAAANAGTIAGDLASFGFNMDLAPVADVWSNPSNTVIGNRAYSTDFQEAAELVSAAVEGFHRGGVACTLKHFPGHGDTLEDSHTGVAYVHRTLAQLREAELLPFRAGMAAGADAVMVGHLIVEDIDSEPATLSHAVVTGLLREEMGFQGLIMTDSLQMEAMTKRYGAGEVVVRAIEAGVDALLCPEDLKEATDALLAAVEEGRITEARLDRSVQRMLQLKEKWGILQ